MRPDKERMERGQERERDDDDKKQDEEDEKKEVEDDDEYGCLRRFWKCP